MIAMQADLLIGAKIYFAEVGKTIGGNVISKTLKPADTVATVISPEMGCVSNIKHNPETKDAGPKKCPLSTGGYGEIERIITLKDKFAYLFEDYNEIIHRLALGLGAETTTGGELDYLVNSKREVAGWVFAVLINEDGQNFGYISKYGKWTLTDEPAFEDAFGKPQMQFEVDRSAANKVFIDPAFA